VDGCFEKWASTFGGHETAHTFRGWVEEGTKRFAALSGLQRTNGEERPFFQFIFIILVCRLSLKLKLDGTAQSCQRGPGLMGQKTGLHRS
jgi:hypothetical protein